MPYSSMFTILLYGFDALYMIYLELIRTDVVFSRSTVVLFLCKKWKFSESPETFWRFFWNKRGTRRFVGGPDEPRGGHNPPGCARPPRRALVYRAHLVAHLGVKPTPKNPINIVTIRNNPRISAPPPQLFVSTKNQSGGVPVPCWRGVDHLWWPSSSSQRRPWRGGSSPPSGLRVCTSSYVFNLSLPCSWDDTILMYHRLC